MYPPYSPLEYLTWNAIWRQMESVQPEMRQLLLGLLHAEALVRRGEFARRRGLIAIEGTANRRTLIAVERPQVTITDMETRLFTLFAE